MLVDSFLWRDVSELFVLQFKTAVKSVFLFQVDDYCLIVENQFLVSSE